jgi:hypothetical protein
MYETDWSPRRHRKGRRRARRTGRTAPILLAMTAVAAVLGGIVAVGGVMKPATAPVAIDAALEQRSIKPQPATRDAARGFAPGPSTAPSSKAPRPAASSASTRHR